MQKSGKCFKLKNAVKFSCFKISMDKDVCLPIACDKKVCIFDKNVLLLSALDHFSSSVRKHNVTVQM